MKILSLPCGQACGRSHYPEETRYRIQVTFWASHGRTEFSRPDFHPQGTSELRMESSSQLPSGQNTFCPLIPIQNRNVAPIFPVPFFRRSGIQVGYIEIDRPFLCFYRSQCRGPPCRLRNTHPFLSCEPALLTYHHSTQRQCKGHRSCIPVVFGF